MRAATLFLFLINLLFAQTYRLEGEILDTSNNSNIVLRSQIDSYKKSNYFYNYTELDCDNPDENYFCQNQENLSEAEFVNAENYNENFFVKYDYTWRDNNYFTFGFESNRNDYSSFNIYQYSTGDLNNDGACGEGVPWDPNDCLVESIFSGVDGLKTYKKEAIFIGGQIGFQSKNILSMPLRDISSKNYGDDMVYSIAYMIKNDLKFNYVLLPYAHQIINKCQKELLKPQEIIEKIFNNQNIALKNYTYEFCKIKNKKDLFIKYDPVHLSRYGHKYIYDLLIRDKIF